MSSDGNNVDKEPLLYILLEGNTLVQHWYKLQGNL